MLDASVVPESTAAPDAAVAPAKSERDVVADAEQAAYERARPAFEAHCGVCHSARGAKATKKKLGHFSIDGYPFGGHHSESIGQTVREVLGVTGKKPTMPMGREGSVRGADLEAIVAWSEAFDRAKAAGVHGDASEAHPHNHH